MRCVCRASRDPDDIPLDLSHRAVFAYADAILVVCESRADLVRVMAVIERLIDQCGLTANVGKCATMCVGKPDWPDSFEPILYKDRKSVV